MNLNNFNTLLAAAVIFASAQTPAHAQYMDMFNSSNMAGTNIAGTAAVNAAIGKSANIASRNTETEDWVAPADRAQQYTPIRYTVDHSVRVGVVKTYIDRARRIDAAEGAALAQVFATRDMFGETRQTFRAYGLDMDDLGDVVTAFWAVNWGAVHQSGRPSRAQVRGLQTQIHRTLAGSQMSNRNSSAGLQQIADDMLVRMILIDGAVEQGLREGNAAQLQAVGSHVRQSTLLQMGFDLGMLNLTSDGFVRR
ncbi:hypothetical protein MWU60_01750 [Yoonia sp. F2084L]|uniref:DUF6683 family protein n=1 Tax=Yoonia sp. F2084L TaxID=2926419 RepID=UPI001FF5EC1F|nr:DUF6683 family protein [Yoonia sp. F2084L]MCK0094280.1 hypothetical protein [Yoonia sp. F2084L]